MSKPVFCLMGPTASGKTDLACELAEHFPFDIISVDSAMIYRGMDIGTAKPDMATLRRAPHHLIDILDPPDSYSAAQFCTDVHSLCDRIFRCGKFPLLVGGTMMYFRALQQGLSALPQADEEVRAQLLVEAQTQGWEHLHQELAAVDKAAAARIHPHDAQRIQRALEVYRLTGKPLSHFLNTAMEPSAYQFVNLMLMPEQRDWLHGRIALRFEQMLAQGFIAEVEELLQKWPLTPDCPSMRSVGYRQVIAYLQGEYGYADLCAKGIAATRQLAKRQLTWLRHWPSGHHLSAENPTVGDEIMAIVRQILDNLQQKT